ncbi:hypothetical protein BS78_06G220800 [Paspalum vaginatum]|nr:hypothetical protein BS78_06G220800 [Paspalum vaginatum]
MEHRTKAPVVAILLCLCFVRAHCDSASDSASSEQEQEIQMLRSKVASLEDEINTRKEETSQLESVVRERTAQMAALVGELELSQVNVDNDESVMKANTHNEILEKQIERLGSDLEDQVRKGESLEARATEAERGLHEFGRKLERAEKTNIEPRKKIQDLGDRVRHAQEKLSELEKQAILKAEELTEAHGMWLPHWVAVRVLRCQVAEKSAYAQRLVEPHLHKAQNKLVPVAKKHLNSARDIAMVYASVVANRSTTTYRICRDAIQPCTVKTREFTDHYWQESKRFTQPYISRFAAASEPHLSRASVILEPHMSPATSAWRRLVSWTSEYRRQVQNGVKRLALEGNQLLTPSADKLLAWIVASALFAMPVLCIYKVLSAMIRFRNKIQAKKDTAGSSRKSRRRTGKQRAT